MKRFCVLAVLMLLSPSAHAGNSFSFSIGGHRIHIESSRYCRSTSCVSISGISDWRSKRDDISDNRAAPATVSSVPAAPVVSNPAQPVVAAPPAAVYKPAVIATQPVAALPPRPQPIQPAAIAPPPAPLPPSPAMAPSQSVTPAPAIVAPVARVSLPAEDEPAETPIGDWQTEGKGAVRIVRCGRALCGYVLNTSSDDRGEAVLVNMKPKTDAQWTGNVYSHDSGDTYYGTILLKAANTLRVEACALGRFYCSGNNWTRIGDRAESLMTSRQTPAAPRS